MNFRESPGRYLRTPRTSRSPEMDACSIERYEPSSGHRWVLPVCLLIGLFVLVLITLEQFK